MSRLIDENTIIKMLNTMDRYTSEELTLCDTDMTFPKNEVFIVDDVFEGLDELPSAQPEPPEECERCMMEHTDEMEKLEAELAMAQPKRGQWHYSDGKPARIGLSFGVICDQCGTESEYCTNFCGECGADMREVTT